jgi:hypothetical protein
MRHRTPANGEDLQKNFGEESGQDQKGCKARNVSRTHVRCSFFREGW